MTEQKRTLDKKAMVVIVPGVPNYIRTPLKANGERGEQLALDVSTFTDTELRRIGKWWTDELLANAKRRRDTPVPGASQP